MTDERKPTEEELEELREQGVEVGKPGVKPASGGTGNPPVPPPPPPSGPGLGGG